MCDDGRCSCARTQANPGTVKELKLKTAAVKRCCKDLAFSEKEIKRQEQRIEEYKADPERDEHDVKKQKEVLDEYTNAVGDELERLNKYLDALKGYIVSVTRVSASRWCSELWCTFGCA